MLELLSSFPPTAPFHLAAMSFAEQLQAARARQQHVVPVVRTLGFVVDTKPDMKVAVVEAKELCAEERGGAGSASDTVEGRGALLLASQGLKMCVCVCVYVMHHLFWVVGRRRGEHRELMMMRVKQIEEYDFLSMYASLLQSSLPVRHPPSLERRCAER